MGGSARVWSIDGDPMEGNWSYLTDINPTRRPMPPTAEPTFGEINPSPSGKCMIEGDWAGSVFLQSGGQPLRGGLRVEKLPDGRYNFSESQLHDGRVVGVGTVDSSTKGVLRINLTHSPADDNAAASNSAVASGDSAAVGGSNVAGCLQKACPVPLEYRSTAPPLSPLSRPHEERHGVPGQVRDPRIMHRLRLVR